MSYKFTLPIYGIVKGKSLSVNWYRNAHYRASNSAKKKFKKSIESQLNQFDKFTPPLKIKYTYYAKMNNNPDLDNFIGVAKKFFQDALSESGLIPDDNVHYIIANSEKYGGIDRENPRVEVEVNEVETITNTGA